MHRSRYMVVLGAIVALLPLLGFPSAWEAFFQVIAGLAIVGLATWAQIDRKLSQKAKAQMRAMRKAPAAAPEGEAPKLVEGDPTFGKRVTDFYPKTGQVGRRMTDLKSTVAPPVPTFPTAPAPSEEAASVEVSEPTEPII